MTTDQHDVAALEERLRIELDSGDGLIGDLIAHNFLDAIEVVTKLLDALARLRAERDEWRAKATYWKSCAEKVEIIAETRAEAAEAERDKLAARLEEAKAVLERARVYVEMIVTDQFADTGTDKADLAEIDAFLHQGGSDAR